MLLCIDIGNTNIVFGVFRKEELLYQFRMETSRTKTADEYLATLKQLLDMNGIAFASVKAVILASVVPPLNDAMVKLVRRGFGFDPKIVGPGIKTGMPILYENPKEVGADRIVNAVAAFEKWKAALIVVDLGTATTFDCVSTKGEYLGGVICPGIQIAADALFSRTSKLPRVELTLPPKVIGRNTVQSMQSGILYGYVGLVDGLVDRITAEMGTPLRVLATGGLAKTIAPLSRTIEEVEDDLTLRGLRILYERNEA